MEIVPKGENCVLVRTYKAVFSIHGRDDGASIRLHSGKLSITKNKNCEIVEKDD